MLSLLSVGASIQEVGKFFKELPVEFFERSKGAGSLPVILLQAPECCQVGDFCAADATLAIPVHMLLVILYDAAQTSDGILQLPLVLSSLKDDFANGCSRKVFAPHGEKSIRFIYIIGKYVDLFVDCFQPMSFPETQISGWTATVVLFVPVLWFDPQAGVYPYPSFVDGRRQHDLRELVRLSGLLQIKV